MIVYRVSLADEPKNSYIESDLRVVVDMIKEMDVFDGYTIHKLEMTKLDYEELPEFTGF